MNTTTIETAAGAETINVRVDFSGLRRDLRDRMVIEWRCDTGFIAGPHLEANATESECLKAINAFASEHLDGLRAGARARMLQGLFVAVPMSRRNHR